MKLRVAALVCLATWLGMLPALAQTAYDVELSQLDDSDFPRITLYVSVTDPAGEPVGGLTQDDFQVLEDSQQGRIVDFAGIGEERPVDVVFVFDTTGSMGGEVEGVKDTCITFAQQLKDKGRDYRLGLVTFWDEVKGMYQSDGSLTSDVAEFKSWIESIHPVSGQGAGDLENDFGALKQASQMKFRDGAQRVFILITDAPPHHYGDAPDDGVSFEDPDLTVDRIIPILQGAAVTVFAVAANQAEYRQIVSETGGHFYDLETESDFTGIINEIGGIIASQYRLVYESARPTHDGTRRGIVVRVGAAEKGGSGEASGGYLEKHLVNIQSNLVMAAIFLVPLLLAAAAPSVWTRARGRRPSSASPFPTADGGDVRTPTPPLPPAGPGTPPPPWPAPGLPPPALPWSATADASACPRCGNVVKAGVRFCGQCGYDRASRPVPPQAQAAACPRCGNPVRSGAGFCGKCGNRL
jgi:VWFA-related protein